MKTFFGHAFFGEPFYLFDKGLYGVARSRKAQCDEVRQAKGKPGFHPSKRPSKPGSTTSRLFRKIGVLGGHPGVATTVKACALREHSSHTGA